MSCHAEPPIIFYSILFILNFNSFLLLLVWDLVCSLCVLNHFMPAGLIFRQFVICVSVVFFGFILAEIFGFLKSVYQFLS